MVHSEFGRRAGGAQLKLLVIDDDLDWCKTLSLVVRSIGHMLDTAQSLEDAKQKLIRPRRRGYPMSPRLSI